MLFHFAENWRGLDCPLGPAYSVEAVRIRSWICSQYSDREAGEQNETRSILAERILNRCEPCFHVRHPRKFTVDLSHS